ncbi:hypothetical protein SFOMI_1393 [Sphingobium fuliginis]|uniref:Uncharacterized protein n=1 Tax=Sphingobium fuliginis (strain ATCC 27551) TaxID=336203 RepID=A0A292ZDF2_SPHSA|nr:hypothetical protein SFOMI_1393 [Sphingobium fuliginis]
MVPQSAERPSICDYSLPHIGAWGRNSKSAGAIILLPPAR